MRRTARWSLPALLTVGLLVTCSASTVPRTLSTQPPTPRAGLPSARAADAPASVGALFTGPLTQGHSCTASVLDSPGGDLVMTAAHCVQGTAVGDLFVPAYRRGATPDGVWVVRRAWVDASWSASQDPRDDVAVLQVAPTGSSPSGALTVQAVTGGELLGTPPTDGTQVTVPGYAAGVGDVPLTCTGPLRRHLGFPAFDCHGYVPGTSGSPFLVPVPVDGAVHGAVGSGTVRGSDSSGGQWRVVGVIGGFHQGGCFDWRSLSAPFGDQVRDLLAVAESGAPGSDAPSAGASGC